MASIMKPFQIGDLVRIKETNGSYDKIIQWIVYRICDIHDTYYDRQISLDRGAWCYPLHVSSRYLEHAEKIMTNDGREWLVVKHGIPYFSERYVKDGELLLAADNPTIDIQPIVRPWVIYKPGLRLPTFTPDPENLPYQASY